MTPNDYNLSRAELQVLQDAAEGLTVDESARKRIKGSQTVKTQRTLILLKLGAKNMPHAVYKATIDGVI